MGAGIFFGIVIILIGISILIKVVFKIDFPVFKILFGLFLIYLGAKFLLGSFGFLGFSSGDSNAVFSEINIEGNVDDKREYNAVFGKANIDLRGIVLTKKVTTIEVNAVFGGCNILLDNDTPVRIKAEAVFGGINLPEGGSGGFGNSSYKSKNFDETQNYLYIKANAVFGGIKINKI